MPDLPIDSALISDLEQVDRIVLERVRTRSVVIGVAGRHVLAAGGKRIRAILALLSAQIGQYDLDRVIHAAAAVELIHAASLVHDDLIDEAERRRGVPAVHRRWDGDVALMVGDYLFALAAAEMALAPDPRIIGYFSQGVMTICEGELAPVTVVTPLEDALDQYFYKIGCKTAALFEAACKAGAVCGGLAQAAVDALGRFGYDLGIAFQIIDDVLDYTGLPEQLGKPAANDLRAGTITLPLIYAVDAGGGSDLAAAIDAAGDETRITAAVAEVVARGGTARAIATAYEYHDRALEHLAPFAAQPAARTLVGLAQFVVTRGV